MKGGKTPLAVGVFVLGAVLLALASVMILWGGRLFTHSHAYVLYFNGDVNGLRAGAAVKFRGVQVGYVEQILLSLGTTKTTEQTRLLIPVVVRLESIKAVHTGSEPLELDRPKFVKKLVQDGLRGQLSTESLLTGLLYVGLDMHPGTPAHLLAPSDSPYVEIPTLPTPFEQAQQLAMRALTKLGQVDLDGLIAGITKTVTKTGELASSPQLKAAVEGLPVTLNKLNAAADAIQKLAHDSDQQVELTSASLRETTASATAALQQTQATLKAVRETLGPGSALNYQLGQTLIDLAAAARSMRSLADYLEQNPSALIRGRGITGK